MLSLMSMQTQKYTTDTVNPWAPLHHGVAKTPFLSGHSEVKRKLSGPSSSTSCTNVLLSALSSHDHAASSASSSVAHKEERIGISWKADDLP